MNKTLHRSPVGSDGTLEENVLVDDVFGQGGDFTTPMQIELINNIAANDEQLM